MPTLRYDVPHAAKETWVLNVGPSSTDIDASIKTLVNATVRNRNVHIFLTCIFSLVYLVCARHVGVFYVVFSFCMYEKTVCIEGLFNANHVHTSCKCDAQEEKHGQFRTMHSQHGAHLTLCYDHDKRQQGADLTLKFSRISFCVRSLWNSSHKDNPRI